MQNHTVRPVPSMGGLQGFSQTGHYWSLKEIEIFINTLAQQRERVDDTDGSLSRLGWSIHTNGLQTPICAVALRESDATRYVRFVNKCYGGIDNLEGLKVTNDGKYLFLVYGHRRRQAIIRYCPNMDDPQDLFREFGVIVLSPEHEPSDVCFARLLRLQIDENLHESVPLGDVARSIVALRKLILAQTGSQPTHMDVARMLPSISRDQVAQAISFCRLPVDVQRQVGVPIRIGHDGQTISWRFTYTHALAIAQLSENGFPADIAKSFMREAIRSAEKASDLELRVKAYIEHKSMVNDEAFDSLFCASELPLDGVERNEIEKQARYAAQAISFMRLYAHYGARRLNKDSALQVYLDRRVAGLLLELAELADSVVDLVGPELPESQRARVKRSLGRLAKTTAGIAAT